MGLAVPAVVGSLRRRSRVVPRVRSHRRFRNRGADYLSETGAQRVGGCTMRRRDRARAVLRRGLGAAGALPPAGARALCGARAL